MLHRETALYRIELCMLEPLSKLPDGTNYHYGAAADLRRSIGNSALEVFSGWSYEEIVTPSFDYYALFERGMGRAEAHRAFRFTDVDGRLLALRPDVTSGVARAAATLFAERPRPLRFCYAANVWRQQARSRAEWRRETTQLGCELIGVGGASGEIEMLAILAEVITRLGLRERCRITLSHVELFKGIAARLNLAPDATEEMRHLMDMRNFAALQEFLAPLTDSIEERAAFGKIMQRSGRGELLELARHIITNKRSVAALDNLANLWRIIVRLELADLFEIDLGDTSELDYYTGAVFKVYVAGAGVRVGSGGRYDELISCFGQPEPAVGFVLDLDALTEVSHQMASETVKESENVVAVMHADAATLFVEAIAKRQRGERVRVGVEK